MSAGDSCFVGLFQDLTTKTPNQDHLDYHQDNNQDDTQQNNQATTENNLEQPNNHEQPKNLEQPNVEETPNNEVTFHATTKKTGRVTQHILDGFYRFSRREIKSAQDLL